MVDFQTRLKSAIESRGLAVIQALYQTNGITAEDLKVEMARWPSLLRGEAKAGVALFFKELSTLPPQAREIHTERARRLTKHEVTHLVLVRLPAGYQLTPPLVLVEGQAGYCAFGREKNRSGHGTNRCNEREPAVALRDRFNVIGGCLASLTLRVRRGVTHPPS